jgi:hypothetical protein
MNLTATLRTLAIALGLSFPLLVSAQTQPLVLFLDCRCNTTVIKQQLNYYNFAIDQSQADIYVFIADQSLSGGGRRYEFDLMGQRDLAESRLEFSLSTTAVMTDAEVDRLLADRLELSLMGFIAGTAYAEYFELTRLKDFSADTSETEELAGTQTPTADPWRGWIFEAYGNFSFEKESLRERNSYRLGMDIDHVTPDWRVRINPDWFHEARVVKQEGEDDIKATQRRARLNWSVVKSLGQHWSAGLFNSVEENTYTNIALGVWIAPAIEYNIFSYDEVPFKEFTIAYRIGMVRNTYATETIFLETEEVLARQILDTDLRLRQTWGNVFAGVSYRNFLQDWKKNRFSINARFDVRVAKGLFVNFGGEYEIINDQISLARGDATLEEILLGQTQLATNFQLEFRLGMSYTFGALYNNIVNTRL